MQPTMTRDELMLAIEQSGATAGIADYAAREGWVPVLVRDNGKAGDARCCLWECGDTGVQVITTNGDPLWRESMAAEDWAEALTACGMPEPPTLATRLRRVLDARGCTVAEAARMAEVPRQTVHKIVSGENANPTVATLETIVTAIGATMGELFADED